MKRCLLLYLGCMLLLGHVSYGQDFAISGKVTDDQGEAILGASVLLKGTSIGTITDADGAYKLNAPDGNGTLVFSYIGFETVEMPITNRSVINLSMTSIATELSEVVVVGYGTQKKVNLTGSVVSVSGEDIANEPIMQTANALIGKMPGVTVIQNSGQPGSDAASITIRGIGTLGDKSDPLVLIDGVPGNMNGVDPREIAEISVLKDAASASIYGSRAANGVILITTKRGEAGKLKVNYSGYVGWQEPTNLPEYVEGYEYMRLYNVGRANLGQSPTYSQEYMDGWQADHLTNSDEYPNVDWVDEVFTERGFQQHHSVQLSGGTEMARVLASVSFMDQNANVANYNYKRYNARVNTDLKVSDKISFNLDLNIRRSVRNQPSAGIVYAIQQGFRIPPVYASRFSDGTWGPGWGGQNPVASIHDGGIQENQFNYVRAIVKADYKPVPGMQFSVMYAPQYNDDFESDFRRQYTYYNSIGDTPSVWPTTNNLTQINKRTLNNNFNAIGTYEKTFGDHFVKGLVGYELITNDHRWFEAFRDKFPLQDYQQLGAGASDNMKNDGSANEWGLQSYFARVNYDYKGKYLLEANVRRDGSSRFAEGQKYGVFPAFSAGWRVSEESFFQGVRFITNLKLKASWGQLGNQDIGDYPFASTIALGQDYLFGGNPTGGAAQTALANKLISWETTETTNFGVDLGMLQNRLMVSAEYYVRNTSDILLQFPIPLTIGLNAPYENAGSVRNTGWDLALGWADEINDFTYGINFNISDVKNEVIDLKGTGPHISGARIIKEGYPINSIYGYEAQGLFQSQDEVDNAPTHIGAIAPGDIHYVNQITVDTDGDGVADAADDLINADDRVVIGDPFPRLMYGMNLSAGFRGFDLSVMFQGVGKRDVMATGDAVWAFYNAGKIQKWHTDYWTPENPDASFPRLVATTSHNNFQDTDYWVYDASYLRVRNLTFGYTFPQPMMDNIDVNRLRLYFSGQNLLTMDNMPAGWDPEIPNDRTGDVFPITAIYSLGIDLSF
jgi:TonB-linked SusC/RagA family outer membrane protein